MLLDNVARSPFGLAPLPSPPAIAFQNEKETFYATLNTAYTIPLQAKVCANFTFYTIPPKNLLYYILKPPYSTPNYWHAAKCPDLYYTPKLPLYYPLKYPSLDIK